MKQETWKCIPEYEGWYSASSLGKIRRDRPGKGTRIGLILKPRINHNGYERVMLYKNGKSRTHFVHCLIMLTFLGPKPNKDTDVNHDDGIKINNHIQNLSYISKSGNKLHSYRIGTSTREGVSILTEKQVVQIRKMNNDSSVNRKSIAKEYNVSVRTISAVITRQNWKHIYP